MADGRSNMNHGISGERLIAALIGGALVGYGRSRGGRIGAVVSFGGAAILAGAAAESARQAIVNAGSTRRTVRLRKTLRIRRPVDEVFAFCKDFENFPRVIGALRRVVDYQDGRSHWEVASPSGNALAWEAIVTKYVPNVVIGWRSVPNSPVDSRGLVRFAPDHRGGTVLDVDISYAPRKTALSDALLAIADESRQEQLAHDLERVTTYIEALPEPKHPQVESANEGATTSTRAASPAP